MYRKKFSFMLVAWYCVNTVYGSPISFEHESDCGNKCKIGIVGREINVHQAPTFTGQNREKRQTNNDRSSVSSIETTIAPNPVEATTQIDSNEQSAELPLLKDQNDFTSSAEYKKAQENLLSASDQVKVKDSQTAPDDDTSSDGKDLLGTDFPAVNIQDIKVGSEGVVLPEDIFTSLIGSSLEPNSSMTENTNGVKEGDDQKVNYDTIEGGFLNSDILVRPSIVENTTTETTPVTYQSTNISSTTAQSSNAPDSSNEPIEAELNGIKFYKFDDNAVAGEETFNNSRTAAEKTTLNTTEATTDIGYLNATTTGDTEIDVTPEVSTGNKLNAVVINTVERDEMDVQNNVTENVSNAVLNEPSKENKTGGDSNKTGGDSNKTGGYSKTGGDSNKTDGDSNKTSGDSNKTGGDSNKTGGDSNKTGGDSNKTGGDSNKTGGDLNKTGGDSDEIPLAPQIFIDLHNVSTSGESHQTTNKSDTEPEQLSIPNLQGDKIHNNSVDITQASKDVVTKEVSRKDNDVTTPKSPTAPTTASILKDDQLYFNNSFVNQYESHIYTLDDWDDDFTDTSSFDDNIEDPCNCCDCSSRTDNSDNYDNFVGNTPTTDNIVYTFDSIEHTIDEPCVSEDCDPSGYSTNYGFDENLRELDGRIEYRQDTDDSSIDFSDDFDSESDSNDLFNSDIEFNTNQGDTDSNHFDDVHDVLDHLDLDFDDIF